MTKRDPVSIDADRVSRLSCAGCQKTLDVSHLPSFSEINCSECVTRQIMPAKFGGFLLIDKLGSGGMGVIYHAIDKELGRQVALKVMKKSLGADSEFVQSFRHEAQAAAALNHRNVVQIYSFGQVKGQPYIAMELVAGGRLDEMVSNGKKMDEARALAIHLEVAEGLKAASDVGLIHGDIKPANILFGQNGEAKVVDFGLASYVGQQQQSGQIWGTPYYIAPEKARGKKVDFRSDIYSLGATIFHALTGQPPFDGTTPTDVVLARLNHPAPSLREFRDDVRPATVALVARMLEAEPAMRYPSYPALLLDMRAACKAAAVPVKKPKSNPTGVLKTISAVIPLSSKRDKRKTLKTTGIALAVLAALIGIVLAWYAHKNKQARLLEAQQAQERIEAALEKGTLAAKRIKTLIVHIVKDKENMAKLEEKVWERAIVIQERHNSPKLALIEIDNYNADYNEAEDLFLTVFQQQEEIFALSELDENLFLTALQKQAEIFAFSSPDQAETDAAELEAAANRLGIIYQRIGPIAVDAQKHAKSVDAYYKRMQEAALAAKKKAAEETARKREELAAKQKAEEEAKEAERRRPIILQQEYDVVEAAREQNIQLINDRNFKQALQAMTAVQAALTLPEPQAYAQRIIDTYHSLNAWLETLIAIIQATPYRGGWSTTGGQRDIIGAGPKGLIIDLGSGVKLDVEWQQIPLMQMLRIVIFYLQNPRLSADQRIDLMFNASLLFYETGTFEMVEKLNAEILKINPEAVETINRFMPGFMN